MTVASGKQPSFVVLRRDADGRWVLVGEVHRRPGLSARAARRQAVIDLVGVEPEPGVEYAAVLRSEWRVALDL